MPDPYAICSMPTLCPHAHVGPESVKVEGCDTDVCVRYGHEDAMRDLTHMANRAYVDEYGRLAAYIGRKEAEAREWEGVAAFWHEACCYNCEGEHGTCHRSDRRACEAEEAAARQAVMEADHD